jgi:DEAD/DEAH box helicase domain-containing protein
MSLENLLRTWRAQPGLLGNLSAGREIPQRIALVEPYPAEIAPVLRSALQNRGIQEIYTHQAASYRALLSGQNVVIATGTASGKTLCYNLAVLDHLIAHPQASALYIFPTKALAQDQHAGLVALDERIGSVAGHEASFKPAIYDGDTPSQVRASIRKNSRLLLTNPDMLHTGILPHHTTWAEFFHNLRYIVLDEVHIYRGVFGSHAANVLRRLMRIASHYGAEPQFILTSATIANPVDLAQKLIEKPVTLINQDGSARGLQYFWIYNPPVVNAELGLRRSATQESVRLAADLFEYDVQTAIFTRTRRSVELLLMYMRESISAPATPGARTPSSQQAIRGYRSGYLPRQRREIEEGLRSGQVRTVVATNALELGVDIGGMGAVIMAGYPGSIAATWQQAGRAGRKTESSLAILVLTADPLDQYLATHPEYFFEKSVEQVLINPDNALILLAHLRCAAFELPFSAGENFGSLPHTLVAEYLDFLYSTGELHHSGDRYFWIADQYPAGNISLRTASMSNILLQVVVGGQIQTIGQVDQSSALWISHPQAIYIHEGQSYHVDALDLEQKVARLSEFRGDFYTEPRTESQVQLVELLQEQPVQGGVIRFGAIQVTSQVIGYKKIHWATHEVLGTGTLDLPSTTLQTTGYWLTLSDDTVSRLRQNGAWRNDPNDYGPNWLRQRALARQRDGYCCQVCGSPEEGREHDVHHRQPFRTYTSWEQANQLHNLVTLCQPCHRRVETVVRVRSGLGGLSHLLGHLAPLFLMCDTRDLGVQADPQSPLSDGLPAVVLYDLIPDGIGLSKGIFEMHAGLLTSALDRITACPCQDGCPSCVGPGGELGTGGKAETEAILEILNGSG